MPQDPAPPPQDPTPTPPPNRADLAAAERLAGIAFDDDERDMILPRANSSLNRYARRQQAGLAPNSLAPATTFDPWLGAGAPNGATHRAPARPPGLAGPAPEDPVALAYAPAWQQAAWLRGGEVTSVQLTELALERIARLDPQLHACITVTADLAREQAARAAAELAAGRDRGPLHGLTWAAKDLFDTAGIPTTWGAEPYRDRVPDRDATVVARLHEAGAVLVAKSTLGALAMGDVWFGGKTRSPWNPELGSSGSSAGSAAGVGAGLYSFALGTETYGSIVSPTARCGVTGLRPTFGRVPRSGAMALCWSLDKVGPLARSVRDTRLVLDAIAGPDGSDASCQAMALDEPTPAVDPAQPLAGLRIGANADWFEGRRADPAAAAALEAARALGAEVVEVALPEGPHDCMLSILDVEAAAAFEELTRSGRDELLVRQDAGAWPNSFRAAWLVPAVELLQADRYRRDYCARFEAALDDAGVDLLLSPPFAADLLLTTNFSGHPCLTLRCAVGARGPQAVTLWGRLAGEGTLFRAGEALEEALGVAGLRPEIG